MTKFSPSAGREQRATVRHFIGIVLSGLFLTACASGPRIDTSIGGIPPRLFAWMLDPATTAGRLGVYLDELAAQGYAKQIRIIYTYDWGPFIRDVWMPVIRAKGFRVLAILGQSGNDAVYVKQREWIATGLPAIADVLDAVQIANEPNGYSGKTPSEYAAWHRQLIPLVRAAVPGVPIVGPDLRGIGGWSQWVKKTGLVYGQDYDILSLHVNPRDRLATLQAFVRNVRAFTGQQTPRVWITEGDWGQADAFSQICVLPGRSYVYGTGQ